MTTRLAKSKVLLSLLAAVAVSLGWAETYDVSPSGDATTDTTAINDAIQNAEENSVITLAPGTYKINATIDINKPVTLQGTGWEDCILDAEKRAFKFVVLNNAKAHLTGVTVANGRPDNHFYGMCVTCETAGGKLSWCRVTGGGSNGKHPYGAVCANGKALNLYNCIIDNNKNDSTGYAGGGVYLTSGVVYSCLVANNYSAYQGAGGRFSSGNAIVVNCTFVGNTVSDKSTGKGGGISSDGNAVIINSCFYGNMCVAGGASISTESKVFYCATPEKLGGNPVELNESPFVDYEGENYALKSGSPCFDKGDAVSMTNRAGAANVVYDLAKADRVMGETVDIGCYEYNPNTFTLQAEAARYTAFPNEEVAFKATVGGTSEEGATFDWTFTPKTGGSAVKKLGNPVLFSAAEYGYYTASVTFSNGSQSKTAECPKDFRVAPATNYVTAVQEAGRVPPYDAPGRAATNIQDAVDEAIPGATIVLLDGTYLIENTVAVEKDVTLVGTGWDVCTLYGNKSIGQFQNPLLRINSAGAKVEGVHITHVYAGKNWTYGGSGVMIGGEGGTLAACRVSDCTDSYGTAGTRGAVSLGGPKAVVTRCLVENNTINKNQYNTAGGICMTAGRVDDCIVRLNAGGFSNGEGIVGGGGGIVAMGGLVLNCTVVSNTCVDVAAHPDSAANIAAIGTAVVRNCLMQGKNVDYYGATGTACSYSLVSEGQTVPAGDGNFAGSVLFKNGGYVPRASSVVSRKGSAAGYEDVLVGAVDYYGKPRVRGDGSVDIGCAQANLNGLILLFR